MDIYLDRENLSKKRRASRLKFYAIFALIALFAIGIIYIFIYAPIFRIKSFVIQGNERMPEEAIMAVLKQSFLKDSISGILGWQNMFFWPKGEIKPNTGLISSAMIEKSWFKREISITVKERERFAIWCSATPENGVGNCFWLDKDGVIFEKAPSAEGGLIFTVNDPESALPDIGSQALDPELGKNLVKILSCLNNLDFSPKNITYSRERQELKVETYGGPYLLFSVRFDPKSSIESLETLGKNTALKNTEYVDLRVENKIYYKSK